MKAKKILLIGIIIALVICFSAIALGAGKNSESTYVGTWLGENAYGEAYYIFIYPCHVGEYGTEYSTDHTMHIISAFDWNEDNGYLVIHEEISDGYNHIDCYLSSDGGKTMEIITGEKAKVFTKIE